MDATYYRFRDPSFLLTFFCPFNDRLRGCSVQTRAVKHNHYLIFRTALWTWMYFPSTRNFRSEVSGLSNSFFRDSATVKKSSCSTETISKQTNKTRH